MEARLAHIQKVVGSSPIPAPIVVSVVQGLEHRVVAPEIQVRVLSLTPRKVNAKPSAKENKMENKI